MAARKKEAAKREPARQGIRCPICGEVFRDPSRDYYDFPKYSDDPHADWRACVQHLVDRIDKLEDRVALAKPWRSD